MKKNNREQFFYGLVGALIGSLVGVLLIVLLSYIGIVASIAGYVMAILTINFYKKFAGAISMNGLLICILVMIIMTFFALNLSFTIKIMLEYNSAGYSSNFFYIFKNFFRLLSNGTINKGVYLSSMILLYLFNFIGAFITFKNTYNEVKDLD